jgi:hypothetical protein
VSHAEHVAEDRAERLIRLASATADRRNALAAFGRRLAREVDWVVLERQLARRRLLALLGPRILRLAGPDVDQQFVERTERTIERERCHGRLMAMSSWQARESLHAAGIEATELKGPTLGEALYGDLGRRPCNDIDLLLPTERLYEGAEVLAQLGYGTAGDPTDRHGLPLLHLTLVHDRALLAPVDLHWRVHWYERRFAQERLLPPAGSDCELWSPAPVDRLVMLLLIYARDGFMNVRHACDVAALWDRHRDELAGGALEARMHAYPRLRRVLRVALGVAAEEVGLPVAELASTRPPPLRTRASFCLARSGQTSSEPQLHAQMSLVDGLLSPTLDLPGFLRRQVFPSRSVLRQHASGTQRPLPESTVAHGARTLGRYTLAVGRMAGPRTRPERRP